MEPDDVDDDDAYVPEPPFSSKAMAALSNHEGAIRVLRWAAAAAFLIWVLEVILTASTLWDVTADAQSGVGWTIPPPGPLDGESVSTGYRLRAVITGTMQATGFWPLIAVIAYGLAAMLSSGRRPGVDDE